MTSQRVGNRGLEVLPKSLGARRGCRVRSFPVRAIGSRERRRVDFARLPPTAALLQQWAGQTHPPSSEAVNGPQRPDAWGGQRVLAPLKLEFTRAASSLVKKGCGA